MHSWAQQTVSSGKFHKCGKCVSECFRETWKIFQNLVLRHALALIKTSFFCLLSSWPKKEVSTRTSFGFLFFSFVLKIICIKSHKSLIENWKRNKFVSCTNFSIFEWIRSCFLSRIQPGWKIIDWSSWQLQSDWKRVIEGKNTMAKPIVEKIGRFKSQTSCISFLRLDFHPRISFFHRFFTAMHLLKNYKANEKLFDRGGKLSWRKSFAWEILIIQWFFDVAFWLFGSCKVSRYFM